MSLQETTATLSGVRCACYDWDGGAGGVYYGRGLHECHHWTEYLKTQYTHIDINIGLVYLVS